MRKLKNSAGRFAVISSLTFAWSVSASAQYGDVGYNVPTTPAQQAAIDSAIALLEMTGESFSGISVSAAELEGNAPAATNPDGHIGIDFGRIDEVVPPGTPGAPGYPGILVMILVHEMQHLRHGWGRSFCQEVELTVYVATLYVDFVCSITAAGGGPVDALCKAYEHTRGNVNDPGLQAQVAAAGCSGNTGPIPPCPCCP